MKKILLFGLVCLSSLAFSQKTLLFEISGNGLEHKSYLFGTMHVGDEEAFGWNDSVFYAINASDEAAFELDLDQKNIKKSLRPEKKVLKEWEAFAKEELAPEVEKRIDPDTLAVRCLSVYGKVMDIAMDMMAKGQTRESFVDMYLHEYAKQNEKPIVGIESIKEQLDIFLQIDKQLVKKGIINFLEKDNWDIDPELFMGSHQQLLDAYSTKELERVCNVLDEQLSSSSNEMVNGLYKRIFYDRNAIMVERTLKMLKNQSTFIAVGAGHLCGETGLIEQYKKAGYTIREMDIASETSSNREWTTFENDEISVSVPQGADLTYSEYDDGELYVENVKSSLYTTKGKATFSIQRSLPENKDEMLMVEDAYDWEDAPVAEEWAAEAEDQEGNDEVIYEGEESVEEYDVYEYEEVEEYEAYESEEVEEAYEVYIETDHDEPFGEVDEAEEETEEVPTFDSEEPKKEEGYWEIVENRIKMGVMKQLMGSMMNGRDFMGVAEEPQIDSLKVEVMGEMQTITTSKAGLGTNERSMIIETEDSVYTIAISGDTSAIKMEELLPFFESFTIK